MNDILNMILPQVSEEMARQRVENSPITLRKCEVNCPTECDTLAERILADRIKREMNANSTVDKPLRD